MTPDDGPARRVRDLLGEPPTVPMTPAPIPQHDHGAAGFCTDHAQSPDERVETVARVLREHQRCRCCEGCQTCPSIDVPIDRHQAAAVVAALDDETARLRDDIPVERDLLRYRQAAGENESTESFDRAEWLADMDEWLSDTSEPYPYRALIAQRDAARAALDRVRALADEWARDDAEHLATFGQHHPASLSTLEFMLRAALDDEEPR